MESSPAMEKYDRNFKIITKYPSNIERTACASRTGDSACSIRSLLLFIGRRLSTERLPEPQGASDYIIAPLFSFLLPLFLFYTF